MLNVYQASRRNTPQKSLVVAVMAALVCVGFASKALADAGDRDLDVNAINPAPNLLAPSTTPAPAGMHRMKPVSMARIANRHHGYGEAKDPGLRY